MQIEADPQGLLSAFSIVKAGKANSTGPAFNCSIAAWPTGPTARPTQTSTQLTASLTTFITVALPCASAMLGHVHKEIAKLVLTNVPNVDCRGCMSQA